MFIRSLTSSSFSMRTAVERGVNCLSDRKMQLKYRSTIQLHTIWWISGRPWFTVWHILWKRGLSERKLKDIIYMLSPFSLLQTLTGTSIEILVHRVWNERHNAHFVFVSMRGVCPLNHPHTQNTGMFIWPTVMDLWTKKGTNGVTFVFWYCQSMYVMLERVRGVHGLIRLKVFQSIRYTYRVSLSHATTRMSSIVFIVTYNKFGCTIGWYHSLSEQNKSRNYYGVGIRWKPFCSAMDSILWMMRFCFIRWIRFICSVWISNNRWNWWIYQNTYPDTKVGIEDSRIQSLIRGRLVAQPLWVQGIDPLVDGKIVIGVCEV